MTFQLLDELAQTLAAREAEGLLRRRRVVDSPQGPRLAVDGCEQLHFGSNDYLGLANHPRLIAAVKDGADRYGVGTGASHLISGHCAAHEAVERELAEWAAPCAPASALLFSTGYMANLSVVSALVGRDDAVFGDKLNHACLNDAALLSRAEFVRYPHADAAHLERRLQASKARRKLICTDAVFSMDGDLAPLPTLLELADAHGAWLLVDDAHGFGVLGQGRGALAHYGLASERIIYMGTLGKAAGVAGAFVCAHPTVIETLVQTARPYIFTTAAPALLACALRASLAIIRDEPARRTRLAGLIQRWRSVSASLPWRQLPSETAIQPLILGQNAEALRVSQALWERGIWVPAIRPPTVPRGSARLRITLSAAHTDDHIDALAAAIRAIAAE